MVIQSITNFIILSNNYSLILTSKLSSIIPWFDGLSIVEILPYEGIIKYAVNTSKTKIASKKMFNRIKYKRL